MESRRGRCDCSCQFSSTLRHSDQTKTWQWAIQRIIDDLPSIPVNAEGKRNIAVNVFAEQLDDAFVSDMVQFSHQLSETNTHFCFELKEASLIESI